MITVSPPDEERIREMAENESFYRGAADRLNEAAKELADAGQAYGGAFGRKVFLSDLAAKTGTTVQRLAPLLLAFRRLGWVKLARADLPGAMDPVLVDASSIKDGIGEYQFVLAPGEYGAASDYGQRKDLRRNPAPSRDHDDSIADAVDTYETFHQLEPVRVIARDAMSLPAYVRKVGRATNVKYRSGKVDPETGKRPRHHQNYIHEHDAGVCLYEPARASDPGAEEVPQRVKGSTSLVLLGKCLGLGYIDHEGETLEMEGADPLPELYCTPDGKALVIVENKREILFLVWGGALGVERRGIVG